MRLDAARERLRYVVTTRVRKKIFGLIDVDVDEENDVDTETGNITETRGPWWAFLAW
jgi:hypothetical protein